MVSAPGSTHEEIEAAAHAVKLHAFVAGLPGQYDSQMGKRGVMLSGGKRQRIGITCGHLHAHTIIVTDGGCIVECGIHDEPLHQEGLWACLWRQDQKNAGQARRRKEEVRKAQPGRKDPTSLK